MAAMNNKLPSREAVRRVGEEYPAGCRVALVSMEDSYSRLKPDDQGTVTHIDDIATVFVAWDCGSHLRALGDPARLAA